MTIEHPALLPALYKYMTLATGRIVLSNSTLRWSTPRLLNDPFDMQFDLHFEMDRDAIKPLVLERLWDCYYGNEPFPIGNRLGMLLMMFRGRLQPMDREEFNRSFGEAIDQSLNNIVRLMPEMHAQVRAEMANSKILCLSEVPDNVLMWSHYSDHHRGLVLKFRTIPALDSPWPTAQPMRYVRQIPRPYDTNFIADLLSGRVSMDPEAIIGHMVYSKSAEWAYERERRIYTGHGRNRDTEFEDVGFGREELESVILGARMSNDDQEHIVELLEERYPHATIHRCNLNAREFALNIQEIV